MCSISAVIKSVVKVSNRDERWSKSGPYQKLVASRWFCSQQFRLSVQFYSGDNSAFYECTNVHKTCYGHFRFWDKKKLASILAEQPAKILPKLTPFFEKPVQLLWRDYTPVVCHLLPCSCFSMIQLFSSTMLSLWQHLSALLLDDTWIIPWFCSQSHLWNILWSLMIRRHFLALFLIRVFFFIHTIFPPVWNLFST